MYYAKSKPEQSIKEHTNELLNNLEILKDTYGEQILEGRNIEKERFWELLRIICMYHDLGKTFTPFQNKIRKKLGLSMLPTNFSYESVKHEELSPLFIPTQKFNLTKEEKKLVYQTIYYHHEREKTVVNNLLVEQIIKEDIMPQLEQIEQETGIEIEKCPKAMYLGKIGSGKRDRISEKDSLYEQYCLLKGLLHRLDHSSSAKIEVEDNTKEEIAELVENSITKKGYQLRDIQEFSKQNQENNLLVIGSTGIGKTEAALLWSKNNKTFFTLPIRISINAIFERIHQEIGYQHIGLLHSTAQDYLHEKEEFELNTESYVQSKNLAQKITTCTIDQIFPFVFKYKGYEKMYATLAYSKIIIDEIQAYSPEIVAIILKGLQMIHQIGGKFMVMTATLPRIYKEELEKMGIEFQYNEFIKDIKRHKIQLQEKNIIEDVENIKEKGKTNQVLVICNTINKAIELYGKLKEINCENIHVLHSRFILEDRNEKEEQIKEFSKNKKEFGVWITTQIVEASLDIDFDYLYTEMSTLDSIFQRFGRCYRNREYTKEEPNIFIYTKEVTGIKYIYDEEIYHKSMELLKPYNEKLIEEREKIKLVDQLYSREVLKGTKFLSHFESGMDILNNIIDYDTNKREAQKLLRNIDNITVIPKKIYDENLDLFKLYENEKQYKEKFRIKTKIKKLTTSITSSQHQRLREYISPNPYIEEILIMDLKYNKEIGLLLEKDEEYELDARIM